MIDLFKSARECVGRLVEWVDLLLPPWLQALLKAISVTATAIRLLRFFVWLQNRINAWSREQADKQGEPTSNRPIHFDYTYIEGLIRELEDEMGEWEKQEKSKVEILGLFLFRWLGIGWAMTQIVWDRLFAKKQPRS
jgi:hypothetical protein